MLSLYGITELNEENPVVSTTLVEKRIFRNPSFLPLTTAKMMEISRWVLLSQQKVCVNLLIFAPQTRVDRPLLKMSGTTKLSKITHRFFMMIGYSESGFTLMKPDETCFTLRPLCVVTTLDTYSKASR